MSHQIFYPCQALKAFISHFWVADWQETAQEQNSKYFVTANTQTGIAFAFANDTLSFASVQGHTSKYGEYPAGGVYKMFGVSLYSYAVPYLFHVPAMELNNLFLSPETLLGKDGALLTEKIALATNTQKRIDIFTDYFTTQLEKQQYGDHLIISAAKRIQQYSGNINISDLSGDFCLSHKQFERRFKASTGFNPKLYARIVRFETALNNYSSYRTLTETAHAVGYYDQAHFVHDFKTFSGYSPKKFLALSGY